MAHRHRMNHHERLVETKKTALERIARLERLAVGASPEVLSIIDKMMAVVRSNIAIAELEYSCHQIIANARRRAA